MNYKFNVNGEIVRVWVWNDDFHKNVTVQTPNKGYERTIRQDENGKFFTWNRQKVYLTNYISYSMKELKQKIENNEWLTDDDLVQSVLHDGIENVRFECPLNPYTVVLPGLGFGLCDANKHVDVICKITEDRYKVKDNYKIGVMPINGELVGSRDYYTGDMMSLIKSGHIKIVA